MLCHFTVDFIPTLRDPEGSSQPAEGNPPGSGGRELHPLSAVAVDPSVALNNDAEDVDEFDGFSETQSRYDGGEVSYLRLCFSDLIGRCLELEICVSF